MSASDAGREFADLCRRTRARTRRARRVGEVDGDLLRKGAAAVALRRHGARPPFLRRLLAALRIAGPALAVAALTVTAVTACGPASGSPNCPPGQWYVDKPGTGWICYGGPAVIFTPGSSFAPSPSGGTP